MRGMTAGHQFLENGGTELAPCSTTEDLKVAIRYARGEDADGTGQSLIFRLNVGSFMSDGGALDFLSAFSQEKEILYPPLTYFFTVNQPMTLKHDGIEYTIVDVVPEYPS